MSDDKRNDLLSLDLEDIKVEEVENLQNAIKSDPTLSDQAELIENWLSGRGEIPQDIRLLGEDVNKKMHNFLVFSILAQFQRIPALFEFVKQSEKQLYKSDEIESMSVIELNDKYSRATTELDNVLEFSRKFLVQNKSQGDVGNKEDLVLLDKIKSLSVEKVKSVIDLIEELEEEEAEKKIEEKPIEKEDKDDRL